MSRTPSPGAAQIPVASALPLTAIVCTHERPVDLVRCLDAFGRLDDPLRVIVIDSASRPPCASVVDRYRGRLDVTYIYEPKQGLSRARNRGLSEVETPLVAFVDDDAAPHPQWTGALVAAFTDPQVVCAGGACLPAFASARPRWLSDRLLQFAGITRIGEHARDARGPVDWPFGANIGFRTAALRGVGGFNERLGRTGTALLSGEESAAISALVRSGGRVRLVPQAAVDHTVAAERLRGGYYWRRLWWAGVTRARTAEADWLLGVRLACAAPIRLALYAVTHDRVYLYRLAETAGFWVTRWRGTS
jgi:cellulose synthase/poly-beta-1,6-N-acetylglucosamine synthase-like glycosyltransferase